MNKIVSECVWNDYVASVDVDDEIILFNLITLEKIEQQSNHGKSIKPPYEQNSNRNNNIKSSSAAEDKYIIVKLTPHPGFVVKTRRLLDNENKVFINVFHHELIELEPNKGYSSSTSDKDLQKPNLFMDQPTEVILLLA